MKLKKTALISILSAGILHAFAQGTLEDYNRAYGLAKKYNYGYVPNSRINPRWIEDSGKFWYVDEKQDGSKSYVLVDAEKKKSSLLFDAKDVAAALMPTPAT